MTDTQIKRKARHLAQKYARLVNEQHKHYEDIEMRGGNSFEYGRKTEEQILTEVIEAALKKASESQA
jgi:hypothetical protein